VARDPDQAELSLHFTGLAPGTYHIRLITTDPLDDAHGCRRVPVVVDGAPRTMPASTGECEWWKRRRPVRIKVTDGTLDVTFVDGSAPTIAAVELWRRS
jgi:hypothetical protein